MALEPRLSFITLGVSDLRRSVAFYRDVVGWPLLPTPEGVAFFGLGRTWLSLYPREDLAKDAGVPSQASGFVPVAFAYNVRERLEVDRVLDEVGSKGARIVKPAQDAFWGGRSGYFADPDGFLWEVAWNPQFPHA